MTRVVDSAVLEFSDRVIVEKVVTRTLPGAQRYRQIVSRLGRQVAVPSILINGRPVYEKTPGVDELKHTLLSLVKDL
jgi:hypothetical protein